MCPGKMLPVVTDVVILQYNRSQKEQFAFQLHHILVNTH